MPSFIETVPFPGGDQLGLYVSRPARPNGHAVVVLQEIFGVNPAIKALADQFAAAGYLAVAPDLFWRFGAGIELAYSRADTLKAMDLMKDYKPFDGVSDTLATIAHVRKAHAAAKVSTVGLCLGGLISYLAAAAGGVDAAVCFYATDIVKELDRLPDVRVPLSIHYGGADRFIPSENVDKVRAEVEGRRKGEVFVYPGAEHGFYTRGADADRHAAHERVLLLLLGAISAPRRTSADAR